MSLRFSLFFDDLVFSLCHLHNQDSVVCVSLVAAGTEGVADASGGRQLSVVHRTPARQIQAASSILR